MSKNTRKSLRTLKRNGMTAEELWRTSRAKIIENSKQDGWRISELAASLADFYMDMEVVFGKRVMQKADAAIKAAEKKES